MKKVISLVLLSAFMSVILLGCQSEDSTTINVDKPTPEQQSEDSGKLILDGEITKVSISKTKGNSETVLEDSSSIETLKSIISSAVKENGEVNMANPEFYMDVTYENENIQSFHLWIGEKGQKSTLMKTDDTHTIYTVSEEMNDKLIDLIE